LRRLHIDCGRQLDGGWDLKYVALHSTLSDVDRENNEMTAKQRVRYEANRERRLDNVAADRRSLEGTCGKICLKGRDTAIDTAGRDEPTRRV
jgi:hypothetical protein